MLFFNLLDVQNVGYLRSLHTESKKKVINKKLRSHKKIRTGFDFFFFCMFRSRSKHFERCFDSSEPPYKRTQNPEWRWLSSSTSCHSTKHCIQILAL